MSSTTQTVAAIAFQAKRACAKAAQYAWDIIKPDGHWYGELKANATLTAEQVFFYQSLGLEKGHIPDAAEYKKYLLHEQQADGSWTIAPDYPGDVSTSCEAYVALKILGVPTDAPEMQRARSFIRDSGGVAKVRVFTRIYFAQFGLFPWAAIPQLPAELILLPSYAPLNIYRLASWARSTVVPLLIIAHHRPIYALPNGKSPNNTYADELWLDPTNKMAPLGPSLFDPFGTDLFSYFFTVLDTALYWLDGLRLNPLRGYARRQCIKWILERQEKAGDWAGIIPPMHFGVQALLLEGYKMTDKAIILGMEAIERFTWSDKTGGKRLQSCVSPLWDTVLMVHGLCDVGLDPSDVRLRKAVRWIRERQIHEQHGDWLVYSPTLISAGWSFEYYNTWYPDVDNTAAALITLIKHSPSAVGLDDVVKAAWWICGMQNPDGGWGAFDKENDRLWLNRIPFSDMNSLCDPSTPDVTGHMLEVFGLMMHTVSRGGQRVRDPALIEHMERASARAIVYLIETQEPTGAWYGRWGVNYLYGTSNVLCGLAYFANGDTDEGRMSRAMAAAGARWIKQAQNPDGGWGEALQTYRDPSWSAPAPSTPSQTAWALMGLLATCTVDDEAVLAGVAHLVGTQTDVLGEGSASWPERLYTGTGFPNFFYIGYTLYRHYFPLMALGRFVRAAEAAKTMPKPDMAVNGFGTEEVSQ
ncbi:uncharacterized protein E0L32_000163 [Thyridium curvatum]|uniref:Terpene cyclase/mutase family member n=1 Tax=Thyridium curvatum TaxID=1093900 RepID=A0A507BEX5_9PEZI|nr:uncharacterized protein E0L32_000163 [Thyridium curvatum]TPX15829.1 hypothetical protein E0L32_000163 [Thyridium curvatum]